MKAETSFRAGNTRAVYQAVNQLIGKAVVRPGLGIKAENGSLIYDKEGMESRWMEYCKNSFEDSNISDDDADWSLDSFELEPSILKVEIRKLIRKSKNNKAVGLDGIPMEALKAGGETVINCLKFIFDRIWQTAEWPERWTVSELVVMRKVAGTQDCTKHRTSSLLAICQNLSLTFSAKESTTLLDPKYVKNSSAL